MRRLIYRRAPRLEIDCEGDGGGHILRVLAADGTSALGSAPTMALLAVAEGARITGRPKSRARVAWA